MFTGIVRAIGTVEAVRSSGTGRRLAVSIGELARGLSTGDSVAVSGVCLTVAALSGERAEFDAVEETLRRSTLGEYLPGRRVNLEPALRAGDPLGGHIVTGHVEGVAVLRSRERSGEAEEFRFELPAGLLEGVVEKGSIALDGVSLTVAELFDGGIRVALVPHTLRATTLGELRPGERVNVETDYALKAVAARAGAARAAGGGLTLEFLREHGFA